MSKITVTGQITVTGGQLAAKETPAPAPTGPQLWAWGQGGFGAVGDSTNINRSSPVQIGELVDWANVGSGFLHSHALKTDGTLWSWGRNNVGQLGLGDTVNKNSPNQVGILTDWATISGGSGHSLAVKTDGTLWAIGQASNHGQLGDSTAVNKSSPVQVGNLTTWASVSAGRYHSVAIKTNGSLWTWGRNSVGYLGDNTNITRSSPVQIGSLTDWSVIAAGQHSLAVNSTGELWGWGPNYKGHLGDGTIINRSSPVQIGLLSDWASVATGVQHSVAIKTNGTLWAWGEGGVGATGHGSSTDTSSPIQVGSLTDWASVKGSANAQHSLVIKTDGTLWAFGENSAYGRLGLGYTGDVFSPVQVGTDTNWTSAVANGRHSLAIKTV